MFDIDNRKLGAIVKNARKEKKLNNQQAAELLEISTVSLSNIETGKKGMSLRVFSKICNIFDLDAADVLKEISTFPSEKS